MSLFLFRHGEAYQIEEMDDVHRDEDRPLTPKGESTTAEVCRGLRKLKVRCDQIWHSPMLRAVETAEVVAREMECSRVSIREGLAYDAEDDDLFDSLADIDPSENLFLVGHQPSLGEWLARLISGEVTDTVSVSKSGVSCLEIIPGSNPPVGNLRWLLRAKHLRLIGRG